MKKQICESEGCTLIAEWIDPMENKICSDCMNDSVSTGEYEECEVIKC